MNHEGSTFLSGCAPLKGYMFCAKEVDELVAAGNPNSTFLCFDEDDADAPFARYEQEVSWPAISIATVKPAAGRTVVAIGPNGDFWEAEPATLKETVGTIKDFRGNLRVLSVIDEKIYACGMDRVVLRREGLDNWVSIGPGPRKDDPDVVGFEDIGGYNANEMYAVGWGGEIWWRNRGKWRSVDSPTSVNLRALCCTEDGVYAVGKSGTMLRGRRDEWSLLETGRTENLMDVAEYGGAIYVTTDFRILKLADGGLANDTDFADEGRPVTCLYLLRADDGLLSLGTKDLFRRNGGPWTRIV